MSVKIWQCVIGYVTDENLPYGADLPMRNAASTAYRSAIGQSAKFNFSGWRGSGAERYWFCKIGECPADIMVAETNEVMRIFVEQAFLEVTGQAPNHVISDWDARLDQNERYWL